MLLRFDIALSIFWNVISKLTQTLGNWRDFLASSWTIKKFLKDNQRNCCHYTHWSQRTFFVIKLWTEEFWSFWFRTLHLLNWIFGQNKMFWHSVHSRLIGHAFQVLFKTKKCGLISSFWTSWNFQKFNGKLIIICCLMIMKTLMTLASASIHPSFVCTSCRTCWVVNMGWASSFSWLWCIVLITHVIYRREEKKRGTQSKSCCGSRP